MTRSVGLTCETHSFLCPCHLKPSMFELTFKGCLNMVFVDLEFLSSFLHGVLKSPHRSEISNLSFGSNITSHIMERVGAWCDIIFIRPHTKKVVLKESLCV